MTGRVLAVDFGMARIGLAISDPLGILASGLETINWNGSDWAWAVNRIAELCQSNQVVLLLFGLPRKADGRSSDLQDLLEAFVQAVVAATGLKYQYFDERYTTVIANRILQGSSVKKKQRRSVVDQIAAAVFLQDFLDSKR